MPIFKLCNEVIQNVDMGRVVSDEMARYHKALAKQNNRKVLGVPQSQSAANPRHKKEEKNNKS